MKDKLSIPVLIIVSGAFLRLFLAYWWGFSNDELSALSRTIYSSFSELIEEGVMATDMHPAGVQIFLNYWVKIFGTNELVVRLPFVLASSFGLYGFYRFFQMYWKESALITFLILTSFLFYPIMDSQFARPYAFGFFFIGMALLAFQKLIQEEKNWKHIVVLGLCWAGVFYSNYFATLFAGVLGLLLLPLIPRKKLLFYIAGGALGVLLYLPHLGITMHHLDQGGLGWLPPPTADFILAFLFHLSNESLVLMWIFILLIIGGFVHLILHKEFKHQWMNLWSLTCFASILLIAYYYSIYVTPILKFQTLFFAFPFLFVVVSDWMKWPFQYLKKWFYPILTILVLSTSIFSMRLFCTTCHYAVYRELARDAKIYVNEYGEENIEFITTNIAPWYVNFYLEKYGMNYQDLEVGVFLNFEELDSLMQRKNSNYLFYAYSNFLQLPKSHEVIRKRFPGLLKANQYFHSGTWLYSKKEGERQFKKEYNLDILIDSKDSADYKVIPPQAYSKAFRIPKEAINFDEIDYHLFRVDCLLPDGANLDLIHVVDSKKQMIQNEHEAYYLAQGNEGKFGKQTIDLVADFKFHLLKDKEEVEFVFFLWNNSDQPVYIQNASLYLVDPRIPDKFK